MGDFFKLGNNYPKNKSTKKNEKVNMKKIYMNSVLNNYNNALERLKIYVELKFISTIVQKVKGIELKYFMSFNFGGISKSINLY